MDICHSARPPLLARLRLITVIIIRVIPTSVGGLQAMLRELCQSSIPQTLQCLVVLWALLGRTAGQYIDLNGTHTRMTRRERALSKYTRYKKSAVSCKEERMDGRAL